MPTTFFAAVVLLACCGAAPPEAASENLIANGGFEEELAGWAPFWSRESGGRVALDPQNRHAGKGALRVEHGGDKDWAVFPRQSIRVKPGEIYELSAWLRCEGQGNVTLCVTPRDAADKVLDWSFAGQTVTDTGGWRRVETRFLVPDSARVMLPRVIGYGPATVWIDGVELRRAGELPATPARDADPIRLENAALTVLFHPANATIELRDRRGGQSWKQQHTSQVRVLKATAAADRIHIELIEPVGLLRVDATLKLEPDAPELAVELASRGAFGAQGEAGGKAADEAAPLATWAFPNPFVAPKSSYLVMPVNEGMSYPVADATLEPMHYHLYGGHGLCMPWYGVVDGGAWLMTLVETPDDAQVRVPRHEGLLRADPLWVGQKGHFGPPRRLRYIVGPSGDYVAMAKRYRRHVQESGLFKTLAEKRKAVPAVDRLVGAVNVWCWDKEAVAICRELQAAGIDRILWSAAAGPDVLRQLGDLGVLTSRYDIYQDTMDPANFPRLRWVHGDWTTDAWPKDLTIQADGRWERGWEVEDRQGGMAPCGVLCDRQAVPYARRRIAAELATHPYAGRFIDTTTASPWRECYDPAHPMTRSESRRFKMDLLRLLSDEFKLVCGSETGHDAAVPYAHFFEGMMSLGPYRLPDSGRRMQAIVETVPPRLAKFQTGHFYRLPLWELVYHDCMVSYWYWGDYNNKLPAVWDRRDLWNALYGTPPMFMFHRKMWRDQRDRFVASYRTATATARQSGYAEMLSHCWLSDDHSVQEARFAGGATVTVNFGTRSFKMPGGQPLAPMTHRIDRAP